MRCSTAQDAHTAVHGVLHCVRIKHSLTWQHRHASVLVSHEHRHEMSLALVASEKTRCMTFLYIHKTNRRKLTRKDLYKLQ